MNMTGCRQSHRAIRITGNMSYVTLHVLQNILEWPPCVGNIRPNKPEFSRLGCCLWSRRDLLTESSKVINKECNQCQGLG